MEQPPPHVVMLSSPGMGHVIPLVELARKLLHNHSDLTITIIFSGTTESSLESKKSVIRGLPRINPVVLAAEEQGEDEEYDSLEAKIISGLIRSIPPLRRLLTELQKTNLLLGVLVDGFCSFTIGLIKELQIPAYVFDSSAAAVLSVGFYYREHCQSHDGDLKDLQAPLEFPGFPAIDVSDLPDVIQDRRTKGAQMILKMMESYLLADGIVVNSFHDLEPDAFRALQGNRYADVPPIYGVGPLIRYDSISISDPGAESLKWLEAQPANSVLYVSFGSGGTLSRSQLTELAIGLEGSQQRFLLVGRRPNDGDKSAAYFHSKGTEEEQDYLPEGFIERTRDRGFVLRDWAPQAEILRHPAVGGFLTHCGWNSTLESIVNGVPVIAWPLFAEQKMNAVMLSEVLKVGLRARENKSGIVEPQQIEALARRLMKEDEGQVLRERMRELKKASFTVINEDGSSAKALASLGQKWNIN